jgi:DNA-binding transcriptional ArsR family regulator
MGTDAFETLDGGIRVEILRALAEHRAASEPTVELSFSELRERVGLRDSGQFNYHLDKLRGQFVAKSDEGYDLTPVGQQVASALLSGVYEQGTDHDPVELDDDCPVCDEPLSATYETGVLKVLCPAEHGFSNTIPPGTFEGR